MKPHAKFTKTMLKANTTYEGESVETRMRKIENTKEAIKDGAPMIYTERKAGVMPAYDIRTDRWEIAQQAMDSANRSWVAQRDNRIQEQDNNEQEQEQKPN